MNESDFRIKYSELIEYYQLIEMRLRGICAFFYVDDITSWFKKLDDYETDALCALLNKVKSAQKEKRICLFSELELEELNNLRNERNYWVHECFGGNNPIVFSHGIVKNTNDVLRISNALNLAIEWDEKLTEKSRMFRDKVKINEEF